MIASIRTCRVPPYGSVIPRSIYIQKRFLSNSSDNNTNKPSSEQDSNESNTKQGKKLVSSLLFGSKSDRENVEEFQKSFSYHLMRGKYVHEIVKDKVRPDLCSRYQELISQLYPLLISHEEFHTRLVGSWETIIGEEFSFVHIWEYDGYKGYDSSIQKIQENPDFRKIMQEIKKTLVARSSSMNQEFAYWETISPRALGGIYEMRSYQLKPGTLLEWENYWRKGLECRRKVMQPIGAWFSQLGKLHYVHHIWQYENLADRNRCRKRSWEIPGWSDTVIKTQPLVHKMKSNIMRPLSFSPIR